jgi:hypothetical protein
MSDPWVLIPFSPVRLWHLNNMLILFDSGGLVVVRFYVHLLYSSVLPSFTNTNPSLHLFKTT